MLVNTLRSSYELESAFRDMGRKDAFSYSAIDALFEHYNEMDETIEGDVIGIWCDWTEYDLEDLVSDFDEVRDAVNDADSDLLDDPSEVEVLVHTALDDGHFVISCDGGKFLVSA